MNFFEAQDKARRNTSVLILLFICAVAGLVLLTNLLILGVMAYSQTGVLVFSPSELQHYFKWDIFAAVAFGICVLIFFGSLYKTLQLSTGGRAVAEMLGGRLISQNTNDPQERKILNVVEEMAIAAGMPIPKVYLLEEISINAFAAGKSPATAVIGITRGAVSQLSRDELQGVIGHEFSHIFNGDMKLNIRLMGVLHGILLLGIIGYYILRSIRYTKSSRSQKGGNAVVAILGLGIGLMVIGYIGTFFGQWIKAIVSRQREYLADASAVQFTRNKDSIAGALKKIGGSGAGSVLNAATAPEYSHAYFANGVGSYWQSLFATHPPLAKRIKSIDPLWDGKYITPTYMTERLTEPDTEESTPAQKTTAKMAVAAAILTAADQAVAQVGTLSQENVEYAHQLLNTIPDNLRTAVQEAWSARALVYAILVNKQNDKSEAWSIIDRFADKDIPGFARIYQHEMAQLEERLKLPLLELCLNALRELSENQYRQFKEVVNKIITADKTVDLNEWVIQRLVLQQLDEHFGLRKPARARHAFLGAVKADAEILLSLIAYVEHDNDEEARQAFDSGKKEVGANAFNMIPRNELALNSLNSALDSLMQLKPLLKPRILKACAAIILADNKPTIKGIELLRTFSACLDCPMPPLRNI